MIGRELITLERGTKLCGPAGEEPSRKLRMSQESHLCYEVQRVSNGRYAKNESPSE